MVNFIQIYFSPLRLFVFVSFLKIVTSCYDFVFCFVFVSCSSICFSFFVLRLFSLRLYTFTFAQVKCKQCRWKQFLWGYGYVCLHRHICIALNLKGMIFSTVMEWEHFFLISIYIYLHMHIHNKLTLLKYKWTNNYTFVCFFFILKTFRCLYNVKPCPHL